MDNAGRISQVGYHAALDRRDKRIAELEGAQSIMADKLEIAANWNQGVDELMVYLHELAGEAKRFK